MAGKYRITLTGFVLVNCLFLTASVGQITADKGNVRNFGATGDGISDDTESIQRAVNSGSGAIYFPKGSYLLTKTVVIDLDKTGFTSLRGDGVAQLIMAGPGPAIKFIGTHFGTADPNTFTQNVWDRQRMPVADGIGITGGDPEAVGIEAVGTMELTLTRINIRKSLHGIHLTGTNRNIIISDCHVYDNNGAGIFFDNVNLHQSNITGCHIMSNKGGGIVTKGEQVRNLQITGCDIESNMDPAYPPAANVFIDCTGSNFGTAEVAITGCTIQHRGTSPGSANIRIFGNSKPYSKFERVNWGNITVTGNIIGDAEINLHLQGCRGVAVSGNTFWQGYKHNMLIEGCLNIVMGANVFDHNPLYADSGIKSKNSLVARKCEDCTFSGLHIINVRLDPAAFLIENCNRMNITNCTILDCDNVALLLRDVSNSRISGFLIRDDRPGSVSVPFKIEGGKGNIIDSSLK
jgi:parallel beta-helix repeat protein